MAHQFLSDEWLAEVQALAAESEGGGFPADAKLNMVVTGGPAGDRELHVADGTFAAGLVDDAPTKLTVPYAVARQMFVEGNQQAGMQAFMSGQIKVEGDMTKLMAMQSSGGDPAAAAAMQAKLQEITAPD
jgi:hypothetical protein